MQDTETTAPSDVRWTDKDKLVGKAAISEQPHRSDALKVIIDSLSQAPELDQAITDALAEAMRALGADGGSFHLLDEGTGELQLRAHVGAPSDIAGGTTNIRPGEGLRGQVVLSGQPMLIGDAAEAADT